MSEQNYSAIRKFLEDKCKSARGSVEYYDKQAKQAREELASYEACLAGLEVAIEVSSLSDLASLKGSLLEELKRQIAAENAASNAAALTPAEVKTLMQPELETA